MGRFGLRGSDWQTVEPQMHRTTERIKTLVARLREAQGPERELVAEQLLKVRTRAAPFMIDLLDTDDTSLHDTAAWIISGAGAPAAPALEKALRDPRVRVRATAAELLGILHARRSLGSLMRALPDPDAEVRQNAAWALTRLGSAAIPRLVSALGRHAGLVREQAAWCLAGIGRTAVRPIVKALPRMLPESRAEAVLVLGRIGEASRTALRSLLMSRFPEVRRGAFLALQEIGGSERLSLFLPLLFDPDHTVRAA